MDAAKQVLADEKSQLLNRLAEIVVEEQRVRGTFDGTPHLTELEGESQALGRLLSCLSLSRSAAEVAAACDTRAACPTCGARCSLETTKRTVQSTSGPIELMEPMGFCPACRRAFFPSA